MELAAFTFEFSATRNAQHFVIKVMVPLLLIVMMSWAVFWIEPNDANTQMAVAVTAMLTLIAYRFAVDADVPKLPYLTRLDAFILMSSLLVFLSMIEVLVTTKFANRDRLGLAHTIDRRCRWIFPLIFAISSVVILSR
jgi:cadmium resistance protein CadD (predicted permease)